MLNNSIVETCLDRDPPWKGVLQGGGNMVSAIFTLRIERPGGDIYGHSGQLPSEFAASGSSTVPAALAQTTMAAVSQGAGDWAAVTDQLVRPVH